VTAHQILSPRTRERTPRGTAWLSCIPLLLAATTSVLAEERVGSAARFGVPMSCAAYATIQAAEYPEVMRVYDDGEPPRSDAEAGRAALGLRWRHRSKVAKQVAVKAFAQLHGRAPTAEALSDEHSRWIRRLMDYSDAQRAAVADRCQRLSDEADQTCPKTVGFGPP
jgi:hypothetical protein